MSQSPFYPLGDWIPEPLDFCLSENHIDVWQSSTLISAVRLPHLIESLSEDECRKARRLRDPAKRAESQLARGLLRQLIGKALGIEPRSVAFSYGPNGKPFLAEKWRGMSVGFNVSHSQGRVVIAIALNREVGVDVEWISPDLDWQPLARQYLSTRESAVLGKLPAAEQRPAFFRAWVRQEAMLKASGEGFARGLGNESDVLEHIVDLPIDGDFAAALAATGKPCPLRLWICVT